MRLNETAQGTIYGINGPVVRVRGNNQLKMLEMVLVGHEKLIGEVIRIEQHEAIVQVYEYTAGLKPGEPVFSTGSPLSVMLGPGIIGNVFDGIQRPLVTVRQMSGEFIRRGMSVSQLDTQKKWPVEMLVKTGEAIGPGTRLAKVAETDAVTHYALVPPDVSGIVAGVAKNGEYSLLDPIVKINTGKEEKELTMLQQWPVRQPRPYKKRMELTEPLVTGQRVIDTLFPVAKGGAAAIPGGFGTGKTMTQHQLAKWSNADIIVYVGCGERGNEIT